MSCQRGITLMEILISLTMLSAIFLACIGVYMSAIGFLRSSQSGDVSTTPIVSMGQVSRRISVSHTAVTPAAGVQSKDLTVRCDYNTVPNCQTFTPLNTPSNTADDLYWHYRFTGGKLYGRCDNSSTNNTGASDTIIIDNVNVGSSYFEVINPTSAGQATVVKIHVLTTSPASELETSAALSRSKR